MMVSLHQISLLFPVFVTAIWFVTFSGFVNGEGEGALTSLPIVLTTATQNSDEGEYVLTVSGGAADNYVFTYVDGSFIIELAVNMLQVKGINKFLLWPIHV